MTLGLAAGQNHTMSGASATLTHASIELTPTEEERCRRYGQGKLLLALAETLLLFAVLASLTLTGAARHLLVFTHPATGPGWLGDLEFLLILGLITRLVLLPLQWTEEHWLDRRFGLSRQSTGGWFRDWLCRSAVFGLATVALLFPVAESLRWWPALVLPWCLAFPFVRALFYDWVYYPLLAHLYPTRFLRHETFELPGVGRVTLPVYQVRVSHKTGRANAAIRLRGKKSAIYVTDTLIDEFTDGEERVVMAHEFGHLYDRLHLEERTRAGVAQAQRKLMLSSFQLLAGLASLILMWLLAPYLGLTGVHDLAGFPLLAALTLGLAHLMAPLFCAEARRDERDADEYALAITGDVENYVNVMRKLRRMNLEESSHSPLSRFLFDTHPSYRERLDLALRYRRRHPGKKKPPTWRGWRNVQRTGRR